MSRLAQSAGVWCALGACAPGPQEPAAAPGFPFGSRPERTAARYAPSWGASAPLAVLSLERRPEASDEQNGAALAERIAALEPGQMLELGGGTWSLAGRTDIRLQGRPSEPIWIVAKPGETPVLTRPDERQNVLNIGLAGPARYLCLRGLELRGGSEGIKLYDCREVWIDGCHVHGVGSAAISANAADTAQLYLTRNLIHDTAGTGEGLYLGANDGTWTTSRSVVAQNHIFRTGGSHGDGIELKQGSFDNWIVENLVHDTRFPCILAYGTGGRAPNRIERNICYNSGDNVLQVQGEAIVRNNLLIHGRTAFASHDHQGSSRELVFAHNTLINAGPAAELADWSRRAGMVFANNAVYSRTGPAVRFAGGSQGVVLAGNLAVGAVVGAPVGFASGRGLQDFLGVRFGPVAADATAPDARPSPDGALIGSGERAWALPEDLTGAARAEPPQAGCYDLAAKTLR